MAEFTEVMKHKKRMCKSYKGRCEKCGVDLANNGKNQGCGSFMMDYPQEAEEIIMKWAEAHPIKTNADKFKEVFGFDISKGLARCVGMECPPNMICSECNHLGFWDREYQYRGQSNE